MKVINGKVWIENTDASITDITNLDLDTYKLIKLLMLRGAQMEIGPGNGYGAGIYCTNLTVDQIRSIIVDHHNNKVTITADDFKDENREEAVIKDKVDNIYNTIKNLSHNYYTAELHGLIGAVNTQDILSNITKQCHEDVLPAIVELTDEEKVRLTAMLEELKNEQEVNIGLINVIINSTNISMEREIPKTKGLI